MTITWDQLTNGTCPSTYRGEKCAIPVAEHTLDTSDRHVRHRGGGLTWDLHIHDDLKVED